MQKIIDFMGDDAVWYTMVPGVVIRHRFSRHVHPYPTAYYVDSHWTSRKAHSAEHFDPYDHYQERGTHGFCQTFAMMHLLDKLPAEGTNYDAEALEFARAVIRRLPKEHVAFKWDSKKTLLRI